MEVGMVEEVDQRARAEVGEGDDRDVETEKAGTPRKPRQRGNRKGPKQTPNRTTCRSTTTSPKHLDSPLFCQQSTTFI